MPRGSARKLSEGMLATKISVIPRWLHEIVSEASTTPWYSPRPLHMLQQTLDIEAALHFHDRGQPEKAKHLWLSCLFRMEPVVFWFPLLDPQKYLCIAEYFGQGVIAWPVDETRFGGWRCFCPKVGADVSQPVVKFIDDIEAIRCVPVLWTSPAALSVASGASAASSAAASAAAAAADDEDVRGRSSRSRRRGEFAVHRRFSLFRRLGIDPATRVGQRVWVGHRPRLDLARGFESAGSTRVAWPRP